MLELDHTSRRAFLKRATLGTAGAALLTSAQAHVARAAGPVTPAGDAPFHLGVATYSLRKFSREEAIDMIQAIGTPYISVKSFHLPYELSAAEMAAAVQDFKAAGLEIVSAGNNNIREDTDEGVRPFFEYAKMAGIPMLVIAPTHEIMPRIEKFVKQYDIRVAIHNHGPEDDYYPGPRDALNVIKGMDPRVGLCIDVGHTARTGVDVVEAIAEAGDRLLDMHMKDLADMSDRSSQVAVGRGKMPVAEIFQQLKKMNYRGSVNLEYEINADDPLPGMLESFAYMRGVLAGQSSV